MVATPPKFSRRAFRQIAAAPTIRHSLAEIGCIDWYTAKLGGGGREELADIAQRMNRVRLL